MESISCIYCKNPFNATQPSRSDVIPDFLGNGLILDNAVCKSCNNEINSKVELPLRDHFQFLRTGLDLQGRRGKPLNLIVDVEVESLNKRMKANFDEIKGKGIPPFKFTGEDGREYYAVIGEKSYIKEMKSDISSKKPNIRWQEAHEKGEVTFTVKALPIDVMYGELGKRLAAKIAFERLCQKKANQVVLDKIYDEIRNYIITGSSRGTVATLIYNEQIMTKNMNFPFPYHSIVLTNDVRHNRIVGVVSLFGLYYYLVKLSDYLSIRVLWDNCIVVDPQESSEYEPLIRGSSSIRIPDEAWAMNEAKLKDAGEFALQKLKSTLESGAFILGSEQ
jgi:hypothetical protein